MDSLYCLDRDSIGNLLEGEPRYRVDQVWTGLYQHFLEPVSYTHLTLPTIYSV